MKQDVTQQTHEALLYYLQYSIEKKSEKELALKKLKLELKLELIKKFILSRMETAGLLFYLGFDFSQSMGSSTVSKQIVNLCDDIFFKNSELNRNLSADCLSVLFLRALLTAIPEQALHYFPHNLTADDASTLTAAFSSKQHDETRRLRCLEIAYLCTLSEVELNFYLNLETLPELKPSLEPFRQNKSKSLFVLLRESIALPVPFIDSVLAHYYVTAIRYGHSESVVALDQLLTGLLLKKSLDDCQLIAEFGYKLAAAYQNYLEDTRENKYAALFWYFQAAAKNSLVARGCLEDMVRDDLGCNFKFAQWLECGSDFFPQNKAMACKYYFIAAERGSEQALLALVRLLGNRKNMILKQHAEEEMSETERVGLYKHLKNFAKEHEAVLDYLEGKARNNPEYAFEIGQWFERRGDIFLKNKSRACDYYFMAAEQGYEKALLALIRLLSNRDDAVLKQPSEENMSETERVELFECLNNGAKEHEEALDYLEDKARNNPEYAFEIGQWFERRGDFLKNKSSACGYYFMAAKQGHEKSLIALGRLLNKVNNITLNDFSLFKQKTVILDNNNNNNNEVVKLNRMSAVVC